MSDQETTRSAFRSSAWEGWSKTDIADELRRRMVYFYWQTDGTMKFPNNAEGDLLKMVYRLLEPDNFFANEQIQTLKEHISNLSILLRESDRGSTHLSPLEVDIALNKTRDLLK